MADQECHAQLMSALQPEADYTNDLQHVSYR
jgi:hypothetical protein